MMSGPNRFSIRRLAGAPAGVTMVLLLSTAAAQISRLSPVADAAMARDMAAVRTLIREGADPNVRGMYDTPALLWVVRVEDPAVAALLLDAGADPDATSGHGLAPLHLAVSNGDLKTVRLLLDAGANPDLPDNTGETALFIAAANGDTEIARLLIDRGAVADQREPRYAQTPLHVAARSGHTDTARLFIDLGAEVNAQTLTGETPRVRLPGDNAGSRGVGIIRGGWPEHGMRYPIPGAKTPLLYATRTGNLELVRLLVESGADIGQTDANGITPLLNAIINAGNPGASSSAYFDVASYLIGAGADVNAADWYGETPLWSAVDVRNLDVAGPVRDNGVDRDAALGLIGVLLETGADPNARTKEYPPERRFITRLGSLSWVDFTGQTAFLRAALAGDTTTMELLISHGADPNIPTFEGTTPLMAAAGVNWVVNQTFDEGPEALLAAVRLAHTLGNPVDAVNSMGLTAIHGAANRGSNDIIEYLAANGASLDLPDAEGRTPIDWAEGVFLATHPPVRKPETIGLLEALISGARRAETGSHSTAAEAAPSASPIN